MGIFLCSARPTWSMRSCPSCPKLFADPVKFCPRDGATLSEPDPLIGQVFDGRFRVLAKAGEGASGSVYRGWQLGVQRFVAIKILHPSAAVLPEFVARFSREARASARLNHPHIVTIFAVGSTPSGLPFIVMEWLDGGPLGGGSTQPMAISDVITVAEQLLQALSEAHGAGVVHRDLKPGNVVVAQRPSGLQAKIVDFGIAKILEGDLLSPGESQLTRAGVIYGTPQYMSPEQAMGKLVDARSDLYSLGVMLYELLAGRLPFLDRGMSLLVAHMSTRVPELSTLAPNAPKALVALIMSLLKKAVHERPASAIEVLESISRFQEPQARITVGERIAIGEAPTELLPPIPPVMTSRRPHGALLAAFACIFLLGRFANSTDTVVEASQSVVAGSPSQETPPVPSGARQALMTAAAGYSLRVLLPEELSAKQDETVVIEVWGQDGRPMQTKAIDLVFVDSQGVEHDARADATTLPGRYELQRSFDAPGTHSMRVLAGDSLSLRVHFEVEEAVEPNS